MPEDRTAILRMVPRKTLDEALIRHNAGESRPSHGRTGPGTSAIVVFDDRQRAKSRLKELVAARKGVPGPKPDHCVDFIFAGPPTYASADAWDENKVKAWAADSFNWLRKTFPDFPVAIAAVHRDESSPHLHVTTVPEVDCGLGWTKAQIKAVGNIANRYSVIQDLYHEAVEHYGLLRGTRNADRKQKRAHIPLTAEAGIEAARRELDAGRSMKQEAEAEKRAAVVQQNEAKRVQRHHAAVADQMDDRGEHNKADALRWASVDEEARLRKFAEQQDRIFMSQAKKQFREELAHARQRHDARMDKLWAKEQELTAAAEKRMAALKQQIAGWEELARKKPWGYGRPLAHAGG